MEDWIKIKKYPHIGLPITLKNLDRYTARTKNPLYIAKHSFSPLIERNIITHPYKLIDGTKKRTKKTRSLHYANHFDSLIFAYYSSILSEKYENKLRELNLEEVPTAYRRLLKNSTGKCNIDFAKDIFTAIDSKLNEKLTVSALTFDIRRFFDNLDHNYLKTCLKEILDTDRLNPDWYHIYKHVVHYSSIDNYRIFKHFQKKIYCKTKNDTICQKEVAGLKYLRKENAIAYCKLKDLRGLKIDKIKDTKGIPQGLPISATLANLYLLKFDQEINEYANSKNAIYKRYSDDIIIVCRTGHAEEIKEKILTSITDVFLEIQETKCHQFNFSLENNEIKCIHVNNGIISNKKFEYLGFAYNGKQIQLKDSSLCKYYYKLDRTIKFSKIQAEKQNRNHGKIFENKILKRYSFAGAKHKNNKRFGNYLTYALKSHYIMGEKSIIKAQIRRNKHKLKTKLSQTKAIFE